ERFAPEGQKGFAAGAGQPLIEPTVIMQQGREPPRVSALNRWVIAALLLVSLIPAALLLMLLWQGGIAMPKPGGAFTAANDVAPARPEEISVVASVAPVAPTDPVVPADMTRPEPDIALTAPVKLVAKPGEEIAFDVTLDTDEVLPSRSVVAIR